MTPTTMTDQMAAYDGGYRLTLTTIRRNVQECARRRNESLDGPSYWEGAHDAWRAAENAVAAVLETRVLPLGEEQG